MNDHASGCIEQIGKLGFKPGTQLNIFCPGCNGSIRVFSDKPDKAEIQKYLDKHRGRDCFFGFSDGRGKWKIQNDGGIEPDGGGVTEQQPKTLTVMEKEPHAQDRIESKEPDDIEDEDLEEGYNFERRGWIKLHRKLLDNPIFKNSEAVHLFIYLLLKANHKPNRFLFNKREMVLKKGQLITGYRQISKDTAISPWKIRDRLKLLATTQIITHKTTHRFSIITICNYDYYQGSKESLPHTKTHTEPHTPLYPPPHTDHTLTTPNKNVKNKYSYVEGSTELRLATLLLEEIRKNKPDYRQPNLQAWARDIDLMLRRDKRSAEEIERVIRWTQADNFWWKNILSVGKLREKFDLLEAKMQDKPAKQDRIPKYIDGNIRET